MKNKTSLFIITLCTLICLLLASCADPLGQTNSKTTESIEPIRTNSTRYAVVIKIMEPVEPGLSKVLLDDSTTILIYRGTESCTMLQLK